MHHRRDNVLSQTGTDVIVLYTLGGAVRIFNDGFWKADYDSLFMFRRNVSSIIHRFRDNEDFLQTENDVINISPLWGTAYSAQYRILNGRHQLYISVQSKLHLYRAPLPR